MRKKVRFWDQRLEALGLSVRVLLERREAGSALVYVYRGSQLEQSLGATDRRGFLVGMGYRGSGDRANAGPAGGAPVGPIGFST